MQETWYHVSGSGACSCGFKKRKLLWHLKVCYPRYTRTVDRTRLRQRLIFAKDAIGLGHDYLLWHPSWECLIKPPCVVSFSLCHVPPPPITPKTTIDLFSLLFQNIIEMKLIQYIAVLSQFWILFRKATSAQFILNL